MKTVIQKIKAFGVRESFYQIRFLPTWLLLGLARLAVLLFPFTRIAPYLGVPIACDNEDDSQHNQEGQLTSAQMLRARQISRLVVNTARYCPWKANCFAQAIVARLFLGWHGLPYRLYFGLRRDDSSLKAHAWVCCSSIFVSGGNGFKHHTVVGCYGSECHARIEAKG